VRVSVNEGDPGFVSNAGDYLILFNGEPQRFAETGRAIITADEGGRFIEYYRAVAIGSDVMERNADYSGMAVFREEGVVSILFIAAL